MLCGALVVLLSTFPPAVAATTSSLLTYGYKLNRAGYDAKESTLGVANASSLHELWAFDIGGATVGQPLVAADVPVDSSRVDLALVGSENGYLYAVNSATGALVWKRSLGTEKPACPYFPGDVFGLSSTPAVDKSAGTVYAAGGNGRLYAMSLSSGKNVSGWPLTMTKDPGHEYVYGAVTRSNGQLYVALASYCDITPYHGRVEDFDVASRKRVATFYATKSFSGPSGGGIWGQAGASVDSDGNLYVATGNAITTPENYGYSDAVVKLTSSLDVVAYDKPSLTGEDVDFGSTPMLFQPPGCPLMLGVENKTGVLLLYDADSIDGGSVQRLQVGDVNDTKLNTIPAYDPDTNMLYVANSSDSSDGLDLQGLVGFRVQSDCTLATPPAWQQTPDPEVSASLSSPTVANGVVYYADGRGNTVFAFDANDGTPLWNSGSTISGSVFATPSVVDGRLYVGSWDGHLYAFGP